jgi:DNA primase
MNVWSKMYWKVPGIVKKGNVEVCITARPQPSTIPRRLPGIRQSWFFQKIIQRLMPTHITEGQTSQH